MPSETCFCPHCRAQLTKSAQTYVLGEIMQGGGGFIGMGAPPQRVVCPSCRGAIDAMAMIRGEYDQIKVSGREVLFGFLGFGLVLWLTIWVFDWAWWVGALLAFLALALGMSLGRPPSPRPWP